MADAVRAFVRAAGGTAACPASGSGGAPAGAAQQPAAGCPVTSSGQGCSSDSLRTDQQQQQQQPSCSFAAGAPSAAEQQQHAARINMDYVPNTPASTGSSKRGPAALGTQRTASSIPIAAPEGAAPQHQQGAAAAGGRGGVWMYPSEQQFFNAMQRKGWAPSEGDMSRVVAIHNTVNERAWAHVMAWEALHACECAQPRLARFTGKPNEYSPKARLLNFLGFKLPFDRHDWVVDRCGREVRYVIDFYSGPPQPGAPASMHLDVRPALDSLGAVWDRLRMQARWVGSGRWQHE